MENIAGTGEVHSTVLGRHWIARGAWWDFICLGSSGWHCPTRKKWIYGSASQNSLCQRWSHQSRDGTGNRTHDIAYEMSYTVRRKETQGQNSEKHPHLIDKQREMTPPRCLQRPEREERNQEARAMEGKRKEVLFSGVEWYQVVPFKMLSHCLEYF